VKFKDMRKWGKDKNPGAEGANGPETPLLGRRVAKTKKRKKNHGCREEGGESSNFVGSWKGALQKAPGSDEGGSQAPRNGADMRKDHCRGQTQRFPPRPVTYGVGGATKRCSTCERGRKREKFRQTNQKVLQKQTGRGGRKEIREAEIAQKSKKYDARQPQASEHEGDRLKVNSWKKKKHNNNDGGRHERTKPSGRYKSIN